MTELLLDLNTFDIIKLKNFENHGKGVAAKKYTKWNFFR